MCKTTGEHQEICTPVPSLVRVRMPTLILKITEDIRTSLNQKYQVPNRQRLLPFPFSQIIILQVYLPILSIMCNSVLHTVNQI